MPSVGGSSLRAAARLAALLGLVLAAVLVAAWMIGSGRSHVLPPALRETGPGVAVALTLLAATAFLPRPGARAAAGGAVVVAGLGAAGIGGVPVAIAVGLAALAGGVLLPAGERWALLTAQVVGLLVLGEGLFALPGYVVYARASYRVGPLSHLPLPGAVGLVLCAVVLLAGLDGGVARWVFDGQDAGAVLLRRLLPVCFLAIPLLWFVVIHGERAGLYGIESAIAVRLGGMLVLLCGALGYTARALRRADERRARTALALESVGTDLDRRVQERVAEIVAERSLAAVLADRERIAADLHDLVIQRLFAVAIDLEGRASDGGVVDVEFAVEGLDDAIGDLRRSIFDLKSTPALALDAALRDITDGAAAAFALPPALTLSGPVDGVPAAVAAHVLAAAREGVSNAVRHSGARRLGVDVRVRSDALTLTITDDGRGMDPAVVSTSGMRNVRARATQLGGGCTWTPRTPRGTTMTWDVPLTAQTLGPRITRTERLTLAMRAVTTELVRTRSGERLPITLDALRELVDADISALVVTDGDDLRVAATCGFADGIDPLGAVFPGAEALSGKVIASRTPMRVDDADGMPVLASLPGLGLGPAMLVPIVAPGVRAGVMVIARTAGRVPFSQGDENAALIFATHVASVLALAPEQDHIRTWPSTEYDYSGVVTRPSPGLLPFHGLPRP